MTTHHRFSRDRTPTYEDQRSFYDKKWSSAGHQLAPVDRERMEFVRANLARLRRRLGRTLHIMDLGCGCGRYTCIADEFGHVEAIDLSPKAIEIAKKQHPGPSYFVGNILEHKTSKQFDAVLSLEVIEHLEQQDLYLSKCSELLREGGELILTTPNLAAAKRYWEVPAHKKRAQPIENWLSASQVRKLLAPEFDVVELFSRDASYSRRGIMQLVNSVKVNQAFALLGLRNAPRRLWMRFGLGCYLFVRAIKRRRVRAEREHSP